MPALPLDEAGKYVAGAYVVFLALLLIYVAIMSIRLGRIDRELSELAELAEQRKAGADSHPGGVEQPSAVIQGLEQPSGGVPHA